MKRGGSNLYIRSREQSGVWSTNPEVQDLHASSGQIAKQKRSHQFVISII
jgi:hypothetical protein